MSKFLVGGGTPPSPQQGKPCINFANRFLYTMKKLHAHHIHHVPKWPSYFCKIWALCVSQIYMVYIVCLVFVIQQLYHIMNMFNHVQLQKKSKEYLSVSLIKHQTYLFMTYNTSSILVHDVYNKFGVYIYIYIYYIYIICIYILQILIYVKTF